MIVKCIRYDQYLTINKIYEVIERNKYWYEIIDDSGSRHGYEKNYFKSVSEIIKQRNDKINKLLE